MPNEDQLNTNSLNISCFRPFSELQSSLQGDFSPTTVSYHQHAGSILPSVKLPHSLFENCPGLVILLSYPLYMDAFDNKRDLTVPMSYPTAARAALKDQVGWDGSPGVVKCGAAYSGKTQQIACSRALESLLEHQKVFLVWLHKPYSYYAKGRKVISTKL